MMMVEDFKIFFQLCMMSNIIMMVMMHDHETSAETLLHAFFAHYKAQRRQGWECMMMHG